MSEPTGPARDSSLQDRKAPGICLLTRPAAPPRQCSAPDRAKPLANSTRDARLCAIFRVEFRVHEQKIELQHEAFFGAVDFAQIDVFRPMTANAADHAGNERRSDGGLDRRQLND